MAIKRTVYNGDTVAIHLGPLYQADGTTALALTSLAKTFVLKKRGASAAALDWNSTDDSGKFAVSGDDSNYLTVTLSSTDSNIAAGTYDGTIGITDGSSVVKHYPDAQTGPITITIRETTGA